ncbi:MAG: hypothetical protein NC388_09945 [Clostridium sp.]|nr:hypothetical protein [Clostridium sp.]
MRARNIISFLCGLLLSLPISAAGGAGSVAVNMVSYEQAWMDSKGALALKNNTGEDVYDVAFQITYLDMSGCPIDYEEYAVEVGIKPGMTRRVDIPAYEHDKSYAYYKSEYLYPTRRFKIKYELRGYNRTVEEDAVAVREDTPEETPEEDSADVSSGDGDWLFGLMCVSWMVGVFTGLYALVASMASRRGRSSSVWIVVSLFISPFVAVFLLLCLGNSLQKKIEGISVKAEPPHEGEADASNYDRG